MSWSGQIDGPISSPILGDPDENGFAPVIGEEPGYRLNIAPELLTPELETFRVFPAEPLRIWAGDEAPFDETVFLLFDDEAAARASALGEWWLDPETGP